MAATPEKQVGAEPQAAPMPRRLLQTQASPAKGPAPMQVEPSGEERLQQLLSTLDGEKASEIRAALRCAGTQLLEGPAVDSEKADKPQQSQNVPGQAAPEQGQGAPKQAAPQQDQAVDQGVRDLPSVLSTAQDSSSIIAIVVVAMRLVYRMLAEHEMAT